MTDLSLHARNYCHAHPYRGDPITPQPFVVSSHLGGRPSVHNPPEESAIDLEALGGINPRVVWWNDVLGGFVFDVDPVPLAYRPLYISAGAVYVRRQGLFTPPETFRAFTLDNRAGVFTRYFMNKTTRADIRGRDIGLSLFGDE